MKVLPAFAAVLLIAVVSGCTGNTVVNDAVVPVTAFEQPTAAQEHTNTEPAISPEPNSSEPNGTAPTKPCDGVSCREFSVRCPDDIQATCQSVCDINTGMCIDCTPSCAGHGASPDSCAGVQCPDAVLTCPDGVTVSCSTTCSQGTCSTCQPDCTVHSGGVTITEIMYNPNQCSDFYCEWIELLNTGPDVDMGSWTLCGSGLEAGYVDHADTTVKSDSGTVIPAGGYALITDGGSGTDTYTTFAVGPSLALHVNASALCGGLTNTNKTLVLSGAGTVRVSYSSSMGANGNGKTLARVGEQWVEGPSGGSPGNANA